MEIEPVDIATHQCVVALATIDGAALRTAEDDQVVIAVVTLNIKNGIDTSTNEEAVVALAAARNNVLDSSVGVGNTH